MTPETCDDRPVVTFGLDGVTVGSAKFEARKRFGSKGVDEEGRLLDEVDKELLDVVSNVLLDSKIEGAFDVLVDAELGIKVEVDEEGTGTDVIGDVEKFISSFEETAGSCAWLKV